MGVMHGANSVRYEYAGPGVFDLLCFFSGLFICRSALSCFLRVLGGAGVWGVGSHFLPACQGGRGSEVALVAGAQGQCGGGQTHPWGHHPWEGD